MRRETWRSLAGFAGPLIFVAAWAILGARRDGYSPIHDPISRLAAVEAPTRVAMTAGFVAFTAGVGAYAPMLRAHGLGGSSRAATVTAAATLGVAVLPLGGPAGDGAHAVAAVIAYSALAAVPLLAVRPLAGRGCTRAATASVATAVVVGAALAASALVPRGAGLAQRVGLTVGDAWIVTSAFAILRAGRAGRRGD